MALNFFFGASAFFSASDKQKQDFFSEEGVGHPLPRKKNPWEFSHRCKVNQPFTGQGIPWEFTGRMQGTIDSWRLLPRENPNIRFPLPPLVEQILGNSSTGALHQMELSSVSAEYKAYQLALDATIHANHKSSTRHVTALSANLAPTHVTSGPRRGSLSPLVLRAPPRAPGSAW